jgi:LacI family transcriptional regulator
VYVPPLRIVTRHSTDTVAMDDGDIALAVRHIREHATASLNVPDLLQVTKVSRRILEQRFQQVLGRSPAEEIRRVRLNRAKELLTITDWKIPGIAAASGFSSAEVLNQIFRRELDTTPTLYRRQSRAGAND